MRKLVNLLFTFGFLLVLASAANAETPVAPLYKVSAPDVANTPEWRVELASSPETRARGLMFRTNMAANEGMLFRFENEIMVRMWMKNTFIPLDMVFMNRAGKIVSIFEGAQPGSLSLISSQFPAKFVLELNAGQVASTGLAAGQTMRHPWFSSE